MEEEAVAKKRAGEEQRKRLQHEKDTVVFSLSLQDHPAGTTYSDDAFSSKPSEVDYTQPWCIVDSASVKALSSTSFNNTLLRWVASFPKEPLYKEHGVITASVNQAMGSLDLAPAFEMCIPTPQRTLTKDPTLAAHLQNIKLLGESEMFFNVDFEQAFLGCVRLQLAGHVKFIAVEPTSLAKFLAKQESPSMQAPEISIVDVQLSALRQKVISLSASDIPLLKDAGVFLLHFDVGPNSIMYVPPGWMVAHATVNADTATAVKRWFMPSSGLDATEKLIKSVSQMTMRTSARQVLQKFSEQAAAEIAAKPSS